MTQVEIVEFNGKIYRRYPNANGWANKWYFHTTNKKYLHRDIWIFHNGSIPKGFDIDHIDGNCLNNSIDNLQCLTKAEHMKKHSESRDYSKWGKKAWSLWRKEEKECCVCHKKYQVYRASQSRYCSDSCVSWGRYKSGKDNLEKECQECKEMFYYNKYKPKVSCSRKCADAISKKTKARKKINGELW